MSKFCAKCGAPIPEGDRFCSVCGTSVIQNNVRKMPDAVTQKPEVFMQNPYIVTQKQDGGKEKLALIIGITCGAAVLIIAAVLALFFMGVLPFGRSESGEEPVSRDVSEDVSQDGSGTSSSLPASVSVVPGQDPDFSYLQGLDMTFDQLAEDGYFTADDFEDRPTYIFNRFGDEACFAFAKEGLTGESRPVCVVTTIDKIFPELSDLPAKEAETLYSPYLTVSFSTDGGEGAYETWHYMFHIDADTSGTLKGENVVSVTKKGLHVATQTPAESAEPEPTPSPTPVTSPEAEVSNFYILPQSNQRLLTYVDIQNFTKQDMMLARNEIFARHGRKFNDEDVRTYFESQSWYKGAIDPADFSTSVFSDIEQKNVDFLKQYEDGLNGISQNVGNSGSVVTYSGYIIPQSSFRRLTYADIAGLSSWQLSMARNEIYARHGRKFNDADIRSYFQSQSWYNGYIAPEDFDSSVLSDTEIYNIDFIKSYE